MHSHPDQLAQSLRPSFWLTLPTVESRQASSSRKDMSMSHTSVLASVPCLGTLITRIPRSLGAAASQPRFNPSHSLQRPCWRGDRPSSRSLVHETLNCKPLLNPLPRIACHAANSALSTWQTGALPSAARSTLGFACDKRHYETVTVLRQCRNCRGRLKSH